MSETRFSWSRVDKISGALELQKRASEDPECIRVLTKDSSIACWECKRRPKAGDVCYYPARGTSVTNRVIGHAECIDTLCDKFRRTQASSSNKAIANTLIVTPPAVFPAAPPAVPLRLVEPTQADALAKLDSVIWSIYEQGRQAGIAEALARLTGTLGDLGGATNINEGHSDAARR